MKTITWHFEGQEISFISPEHKMDSHVLTNRVRFDAHDKKIIITHEQFDSSTTADAPCSTCGATTPAQSTLPVDNKKTKVKSKAVQLPGVSVDVPHASPAANDLGNQPDLDLLNGSSNGVAH